MSETPHDSLFRYAFTQPAVAADHFRAHLPAGVAADLQWETLQQLPGSFVDEDLKQVHSDVLYRVAMSGGADLWLYVLFEHQSTPDVLMAWRVLRYMVRIWDRMGVEPGAVPGLPYIVPMVLYNGERRWSVPTDFHALFTALAPAREPLLEHVPQFRYVLQDLSVIDAVALQGLALRRLVLLLLKHAREGAFWERLPEWADTWEAVAWQVDGLRALEAVWRYILTVTPRKPPDAARANLVARLPPEGQRLIMSWGDIIRDEGRVQGRLEGRVEGRLEGQKQTLLKQMEVKFRTLSPEATRRVEGATEDELQRWTARILTADTLESLLQ